MPNEVNIKITADDLSGPAFASAMAKMKALKDMADSVADDRQLDFGMGDALAKLRAIKYEADSISRQRMLDFGIGADLAKLQALNAEANGLARDRNMSLGIMDALSKMELLKHEMDSLSFGHIDTGELGASLIALRSKLQSLGIADIADVNIPPGRLMTQMQLIKRLVVQSGISDVLDFNLPVADLTRHLEAIAQSGVEIPIKFGTAKLGQIGTEKVPVTFDIGRVEGPTMPVFDLKTNIDLKNLPTSGDFQSLASAILDAGKSANSFAGSTGRLGNLLTAADMALTPLTSQMLAFGQQMATSDKFMSGLGFGAAELIPWVDKIAEVLAYSTIPNMKEFKTSAELVGGVLLDYVSIGFSKASDGVTSFSKAMDSGIPLWKAGGGWFAGLGGRLQLFGGWLTKLGAPAWLSTVTGMHILVEGIVELTAVIGPAIIAFGAFAAAAIPTINDMISAEKNMYTVSQALGQQMPGLSGGFQKTADAVQPNVYILFGEALNTINGKTSTFQTLAQGAGQVMDYLGARIEMALGSNGFNGFISHGVDDLKVFGTVIGNIFGIFGNLLKDVPGYAELLFAALNKVTGALENISGSGAMHALVSLALGLHGAIFYAGLAVTGIMALRGPMTSLVVWALDGVATVAALGSAFLEEAASAGIAAATMDTISLMNPWAAVALGIGAAVAGTIALVSWLHSAVNAQREYLNTVEDTINAQTTFSGVLSVTQGAINNTNKQLSQTSQYVQGFQRNQWSDKVNEVNQAYGNLQNNSKALNAQMAISNTRINQLVHMFGSATAAQDAMQSAGLKVADVAKASPAEWAKDIIMLQALSTATVQLAGYQNGQAAAAQNALNYMGGTITQLQKITGAEEGLLSVVTGSQNAFDTYGQGLHTLGVDAKTAGSSIGGLNNQSFALNAQFITQVDNAQKVIDALQQQSANTKQLTTATATMTGQLLPFAKNNEGARATLVAMINDALGPGTVSLKTLNGWVKTNSTTMQGLSNIITDATLKASGLANVLEKDLNAVFQQTLLKTSGADAMIQQYTSDLLYNAGQTAKGEGDRKALIQDLENIGMSAQDATNYVNGLQGQIDGMHGKTVTLTINTVQVTQAPYVVAPPPPQGGHHAYGGYIGGSGSPTADDRLISVSSGEYVINARSVRKYGLGFMNSINMGQYANGGYVGEGSWFGGGMNVSLEVSGGQSLFDKFMAQWIREFVRVKGGGDVQRAFGSRNK